MTTPLSELGLVNLEAERQLLATIATDTESAGIALPDLRFEDFADVRHGCICEAVRTLMNGIEAIDESAILVEANRIANERKLKTRISPSDLDWPAYDTRRLRLYQNTVRKLAWLRQAGDFAYWMVQELSARAQPEQLFSAAQERWQQLAPKSSDGRWVYGWDTVTDHNATIAKRIADAEAGTLMQFTWPWQSWQRMIRPLRGGMVGIVAAPDGVGKTSYLEQIAEHWAGLGYHVVYVHLENSIEYTRDRRLARHAQLPIDLIEEGRFTAVQLRQIQDAQKRIDQWAGCLHYYDAAGLSMAQTLTELETRYSEGVCQVLVVDYMDKFQPTRGQVKAFGDNTWERQAADMEALKVFCERHNVPALTATQGNKAMQDAGVQTRRNIQGSGQKSQKAQLVVILTRDIAPEGGIRDKTGKVIAEEGEYSPIVKVRIDKQNRGRTGQFQQVFVGQHFRIGDVVNGNGNAK